MNFETEFSVTRWTDYFVIYSNESSPMAYKIYQNSFKILPNTKYTLKILPKTLNILPKWRNFAISGHTDGGRRTKQLIKTQKVPTKEKKWTEQ